ncbi:MAG: nucleoside triphosphate pyrophosphohydrolase family protein [Flavobacteriales bacterium]|nr:nucleoside triphosphate pyrophosphohydrolase family protein [Flavobacteriales bacterium]
MANQMTLKEVIEKVEKFHTSFGIENNYNPTVEISQEQIQLRYNLMREENEEYLEAAKEGDLVEVADALGDQLYILCGTILKHGLQHKIAEVFEEIQRSNMSKLDADGKPIYREDGKVMKSELYFRPDIKSILDN